MEKKWVRKDFSGESKIKDTLLEDMLNRLHNSAQNELPEDMLCKVAAAGIDEAEAKAIEELKKKIKSSLT